MTRGVLAVFAHADVLSWETVTDLFEEDLLGVWNDCGD